MPDGNKNLQTLYQNLYNSNLYNLPDYESFAKDMQDKEKRGKLYQNLYNSNLYNLPDYITFSNDLGFSTYDNQKTSTDGGMNFGSASDTANTNNTTGAANTVYADYLVKPAEAIREKKRQMLEDTDISDAQAFYEKYGKLFTAEENRLWDGLKEEKVTYPPNPTEITDKYREIQNIDEPASKNIAMKEYRKAHPELWPAEKGYDADFINVFKEKIKPPTASDNALYKDVLKYFNEEKQQAETERGREQDKIRNFYNSALIPQAAFSSAYSQITAGKEKTDPDRVINAAISKVFPSIEEKVNNEFWDDAKTLSMTKDFYGKAEELEKKYSEARFEKQRADIAGEMREMQEEYYAALNKYYADRLDKEAEKIYNRLIDTEYVAKKVPKSTLGYVAGELKRSIIGKLVSLATETDSERRIYDMAVGKYNPNIAESILSGAVNITADMPAFGIGGKIGGGALKIVTDKAAKNIIKAGAERGINISRSFASRMAGEMPVNKVLQWSLPGGMSFGVHGIAHEALDQAQAREFDPLRLIKAGGTSFATGAALGGYNRLTGKWGMNAAKGWKAPVWAAKFAGEVGVFEGMGVLERGELPTLEEVLHTPGMLLMLRAFHLPFKRADISRNINRAKPERFKGQTYTTDKLRTLLGETRFTAEELEDLKRHGADERDIAGALAKGGREFAERIADDPNVATTTKIKVLNAMGGAEEVIKATGDLNKDQLVAYAKTESADGRHVVLSYDARGNLFERQIYRTKEGAEREAKRLNGAGLDNMAGRYEYLAGEENVRAALEKTVELTGMSAERLNGIFKKDASKRTEEEQQAVRIYTGQLQYRVESRKYKVESEEQANELIARMEQSATEALQLELTPENWYAEFGEDGIVETPVGNVKMGENQLAKLILNKRTAEFGMIKPTLTDPDIVIEKSAPEENAERQTKLLFIKTFTDKTGNKYTHFESVTVKKDGLEVSVSSHIAEQKAIAKELINGTIAYNKFANRSERYLPENPEGQPDIVPTQTNSQSKGNKNNLNEQKNNQAGRNEEAQALITDRQILRDFENADIVYTDKEGEKLVQKVKIKGEEGVWYIVNETGDFAIITDGKGEKTYISKDDIEKTGEPQSVEETYKEYREGVLLGEREKQEAQREAEKASTVQKIAEGQELTDEDARVIEDNSEEIEKDVQAIAAEQENADIARITEAAPKQKDGEVDYDRLMEQSPEDFAVLYESVSGADETRKSLISVSENISKKMQAAQKKIENSTSFNEKITARKTVAELADRKKRIDELIKERYKDGKDTGDVGDEEVVEQIQESNPDTQLRTFSYFDGKIKNLIEIAKIRSNKLVKQKINTVSPELANDLQKAGIDVDENYVHTIDNFSIAHALKQHGNGKSEALKGQIALSDSDFEMIPDIVENYDGIEFAKNKRGQDIIKYFKTFEDGITYYVEEVRVGRKELSMLTMYKKKLTGEPMPENSSEALTSETAPDLLSKDKGNKNNLNEQNAANETEGTWIKQPYPQSGNGRKVKKEKTIYNASKEERIKEVGEPQSREEAIALWILRGGKIRWSDKKVNGTVVAQGFGNHLGYGNKERLKYINITENKGRTPEELAEHLETEDTSGLFANMDTTEILNDVLNVVSRVNSTGEAFKYIYDERLAKESARANSEEGYAEALREQAEERSQEQALRISEAGYKEVEDLIDNDMPVTDSERDEINTYFIDDYQKKIHNFAEIKEYDQRRNDIGLGEESDQTGLDRTSTGGSTPNEVLGRSGRQQHGYSAERDTGGTSGHAAVRSQVRTDGNTVPGSDENNNGVGRDESVAGKSAQDDNGRLTPTQQQELERATADYDARIREAEQRLINAQRDYENTKRETGKRQSGETQTTLFGEDKPQDLFNGEVKSDFGDANLMRIFEEQKRKVTTAEARLDALREGRDKFITDSREAIIAQGKIESEERRVKSEELREEYLRAEIDRLDALTDAAIERLKGTSDLTEKQRIRDEEIYPMSAIKRRYWQEIEATGRRRQAEAGKRAQAEAERKYNLFDGIFNEYKANKGNLDEAAFAEKVKSVLDGINDPELIAKTVISVEDKKRSIENPREELRERLEFIDKFVTPYAIEKGYIVKTRSSKTPYRMNVPEESTRLQAMQDLEAVNERFNGELQQHIDEMLPEGHVYKLGMPLEILQSTGFPDLPIELNADILLRKATVYGHNFDLSEIKDLPKAIQNPMAIFSYGDKTKAQNILIEVESKDGKKFIVGVSLNPNIKGKNIEVNSIRNVFPKDTHEWINWINQGKGLYFNKEKVLNFLDQQRINPADVAFGFPENQVQQKNPKLSNSAMESATKIIENFENPKFSAEDSHISGRKLAPISNTEADALIELLKKTGLAKEVIADEARMREYLEKHFGKDGTERLMSVINGSVKNKDRKILRTDENGRNTAWENDKYFISFSHGDKRHYYVALWDKNSGKKVGELYASLENKDVPKDYLSIDNVKIEAPHRGQGLSEEMYQALIDFSDEDVKGISSYLPDRINKVQVPRIWKKFGGMTEGDYDNIRFMSTPKGEVYGFVTPDGDIYLDPKRMNANTPIHEFGHLWTDFVEKENSELFERIKEVTKDSPYLREITDNPAYKNLTDAAAIKEAFVTAMGDRGEKIMLSDLPLGEKLSMRNRFLKAMREFWAWVGQKLGIRDLTPEQISRLTFEQAVQGAVADLTGGKAIRKAGENLENAEKNTIFAEQNNFNNDNRGKQYASNSVSRTFEEAKRELDTGTEIGRDQKAASGKQQADRTAELLGNLERLAKVNGAWIETPEKIISFTPVSRGFENEVFESVDRNNVIKFNNLKLSEGNLDNFLDRIKAHNEFAPNAAYTILGIGKNSQGETTVILKQPHIKGKSAPIEKVMQFLKDNGFKPAKLSNGADGFRNDKYEISDLWKNDGGMMADNVLIDNEGNLYFIDADINRRIDNGDYDLTPVADGTSFQVEKPKAPNREGYTTVSEYLTALNGYNRQNRDANKARQARFNNAMLNGNYKAVQNFIEKNIDLKDKVKAVADFIKNTVSDTELSNSDWKYLLSRIQQARGSKTLESLLGEAYGRIIDSQIKQQLKNTETQLNIKMQEKAARGNLKAKNVDNSTRLGLEELNDFRKMTSNAIEERREALEKELEEAENKTDIASDVSLEAANERFNGELDSFKAKTHKGLLHFGKPLDILEAAGINAKELTLSPSVLAAKLKEHGLTTDDLKGLAKAIQNPMFVYQHGSKHPNLVIVTETEVRGKKLSIAVELDSNGNVVEINNISSVHGKDAAIEAKRLSEAGTLQFKWISDKEKVLDWLGIADLEVGSHTSNTKLNSIAKIIKNFENPKLSAEDSHISGRKLAYADEIKARLDGLDMAEEYSEGIHV
jgi:predicted GNAT family acetyltransferase